MKMRMPVAVVRTLPSALAIVVALGLTHGASAQTQPPEVPSDGSSTSLNARWVSALTGMKVETPAGAHLGTVREVIVDGYGRASYAIIAYGGMMGLGNHYTAVPWATVADMLHRDRLLIDQAQLENAPLLPGAKPGAANRTWRRDADSYWRGKLAVAQPRGSLAPSGGQ